MVPKKQMIVHNGALSKGKTNTTAGGTIPPHVVDRLHTAGQWLLLISEGSHEHTITAAV